MIAMAMALEPSILERRADNALDVTWAGERCAVIRDISAGGMAVLFITHDFGVVADACDASTS